jgi:hypothetical protein
VTAPLSFIQRLGIAIQTFFRVIGESDFAAQVSGRKSEAPLLQVPKPPPAPERDLRPVLQLLNALQRDGRLIDFIQQDIAAFSDADVGAAARVVHDGCRRSLQGIVTFNPIISAAEGQVVAVEVGYDAHAIRLVGNVSGVPPFRGKLQHRGWRAADIALPVIIDDNDCRVIAPAEVEL